MKLLKTLAISIAALTMLSPISAKAENSADAAAEPIKVMCLGDSITDGFWYKGAYRIELCAKLQSNGYSDKVDFVGPFSNGEGLYDGAHAGYTGWAIDPFTPDKNPAYDNRSGISQTVDSILTDNPADMVLLQIGTNDILSAYEIDGFGGRITALANQILAHFDDDDDVLYIATLPPMDANDTTYIKPEIFDVETMDDYVNRCNQAIKDAVDDLQSQGKNVELADIASVLTKADLYDGVHPTQEGYEKMGDFWYEIVKTYVDEKNAPDITEETAEESQTEETDSTYESNKSDDKSSAKWVVIGFVAGFAVVAAVIILQKAKKKD